MGQVALPGVEFLDDDWILQQIGNKGVDPLERLNINVKDLALAIGEWFQTQMRKIN